MGAKLKLGGGKTGFYRRLSLSRPSPTLVTNPIMPATDLCHPTEDRPLSVEEYRAIQGFPQDWIICGSIMAQYKQIGNAVPIKLGEAIAKAILADMAGSDMRDAIPQGFAFSRYRNTNEHSWRVHFERELQKAYAQLGISLQLDSAKAAAKTKTTAKTKTEAQSTVARRRKKSPDAAVVAAVVPQEQGWLHGLDIGA